ncbi:hypothetical protein GCM10028818_24080 [Spirosoma horti]
MIRVLTALLFATLVQVVAAQSNPIPPSALKTVPQQSLNRYFSQLAQNGQFNGTLLVASQGKISYEHSFGQADFATKRANAPAARFPIASITKSITATAIFQLWDKGRLDVDDPVVNHLTNFPYPSVTIRHLLSHTAGLPIYDSLFFSVIDEHPDTVFTNVDIIPACRKTKQPLKFQPGSDFSYNNVNYNVLALIIEAVSGLPYETYLKEYIFKPAGMKSTFSSKTFGWQDKTVPQFYRLRYPYSSQYERADTVAEFKRMYNFNFQGHGDLVSTARDLLHFDIALHQGVLVSKEAMQAMFTSVKLSDGRDNPQRYGLGWITGKDASNEPVVFHDGGLPGGRSILLHNLQKDQTLILFDNTADNVIPLAINGLRLLNSSPVAKPKKSGARVFGTALAGGRVADAKQAFAVFKKDTLQYYWDENEMNALDYALLQNHQTLAALAAFEANTHLFPTRWNVYDSYGEALLEAGQKTKAIEMYQKSMALNAKNENGKQVLEKILKPKKDGD